MIAEGEVWLTMTEAVPGNGRGAADHVAALGPGERGDRDSEQRERAHLRGDDPQRRRRAQARAETLRTGMSAGTPAERICGACTHQASLQPTGEYEKEPGVADRPLYGLRHRYVR